MKLSLISDFSKTLSMLSEIGICLVLLLGACDARDYNQCIPSSCGHNINISDPFRLKSDPKGCGHREYELNCEDNRTVLYLDGGKYYVKAIDYNESTIRVVDAGLLQESNCSSTPLSSFECSRHRPRKSPYACSSVFDPNTLSRGVYYMDCAKEVDSKFYTRIFPCDKELVSGGSFSSLSPVNKYSYVLVTNNASDFKETCRIRVITRTSWPGNYGFPVSYEDIHKELIYGFELSWDYYSWGIFMVFVWILRSIGISEFAVVAFLIIRTILGTLCVATLVTYKWRRRHRAMDANIEEFLQNEVNSFPIKYSYSEIKKIARNFKEKLGEGGYGSVYKGKLRSRQDVAIKILNDTKSNGQDFINEVATIGRIHHVNVVRLVGFCVKGSKRALIYDYMPNGSLDKHIFNREGGLILSCKEMYEISLGVARGIEYLHRGCNMQILHFDIKPHNILLDKNLCPKISDFGLAKLYPTNCNTVSLTAARGTLGYMAPELVYKNIGGVSHKADVYSFGSLLMEMAARRRKLNATAEHSSQIYFPSWAYDQLSKGNEIEFKDAMDDEDREITRKMMIVALWCIQMNPGDRPPLCKVLEMLEGRRNLNLPPKPLMYPTQMATEGARTDIISESSFSTSLSASIIPTSSNAIGDDIIEEVAMV